MITAAQLIAARSAHSYKNLSVLSDLVTTAHLEREDDSDCYQATDAEYDESDYFPASGFAAKFETDGSVTIFAPDCWAVTVK